MNEKIYRTVESSGALSLAVGIVTLAVGIAAGVLMIVSGAHLLSRRKDILL